MRMTSVVMTFMVLFVFKSDGKVSSRKKPFHYDTKEAVRDAELKTQDKTRDDHERVARTLMTGLVKDTFTPCEQDAADKEKRFGPNAETMKKTEELVPLDKSVDAPMPIYDDDVGAVDPLQGVLPPKYWEERDDGQQVSLINDFFKKNIHNNNAPFSTAGGNENANNLLVRREFVSDTGNSKNVINNYQQVNEESNANLSVGDNFRKVNEHYNGVETFSPISAFTESINRPVNLYNDYTSTNDKRFPVASNGYYPAEYEKTSNLLTANSLVGGEHASGNLGGNSGPSGFVFYSEPRRATDVSPLNSNLANGIGKIVDTIMKDVIINNLKNDQQKVSSSSPPFCSNEGEVVFTSLAGNAVPPLLPRAAPLESVFSLKSSSAVAPPKIQQNFNSGRKLLFLHNNSNNNKDRKYPMPLRTKENRPAVTSQTKNGKKSNQNSSTSQNQKINLQPATNRSRIKEANRIYANPKNPSINNGAYDNGNPTPVDVMKNDKEKLARLENLNEYGNYLNLVKNMNRANEQRNKIPPSASSSYSITESVTNKQNNNDNKDKENSLQKIDEMNYFLNVEHREEEKKGKNESIGLHTRPPNTEYKIDDFANKLKERQEDNSQSALPDSSNKIFEDSNRNQLEHNQGKKGQLPLPNIENKLKYPLIQTKSEHTPSSAYENYGKVVAPNNNGQPLLVVPSTEQNDNVLLQQKMKQLNQNPQTHQDNTVDGNAYKIKRPDNDHREQSMDTDDNNRYKQKPPDTGQPMVANTPADDQTGNKPTDRSNTNTADPALMIEEINKFILERKSKLESLSAYIAKLRLKKLEENSAQNNAALGKNRRQINEMDLEDEKHFLINNSNDNKNNINGARFIDDDAADNNKGHFLGEDQNLSEDAGFLAGINDVTPTMAVPTGNLAVKQTVNGSQVHNNSTTVGSSLAFPVNVTVQTSVTSTTASVKMDAKIKPSKDNVTSSVPPSPGQSKRPEVNEEELEAMNINVSNKIVDRIFQQADKTENMRANLGLCRKNNSVTSLKASVKVLPETEAVLRQVLECIRGLIKYQLQKQTCNVLDKELHDFLKWMLLTGEAKHGADYLTRRRNHGSVKTDFLFHNECDSSTPCGRLDAGYSNKLSMPRIFRK